MVDLSTSIDCRVVSDTWWTKHEQECGGSYTKVKEPPPKEKKKVSKLPEGKAAKKLKVDSGQASIPSFFSRPTPAKQLLQPLPTETKVESDQPLMSVAKPNKLETTLIPEWGSRPQNNSATDRQGVKLDQSSSSNSILIDLTGSDSE